MVFICEIAFTPALIILEGLFLILFVKEIKKTFSSSSKYFVLSLKTGPIII